MVRMACSRAPLFQQTRLCGPACSGAMCQQRPVGRHDHQQGPGPGQNLEQRPQRENPVTALPRGRQTAARKAIIARLALHHRTALVGRLPFSSAPRDRPASPARDARQNSHTGAAPANSADSNNARLPVSMPGSCMRAPSRRDNPRRTSKLHPSRLTPRPLSLNARAKNGRRLMTNHLNRRLMLAGAAALAPALAHAQAAKPLLGTPLLGDHRPRRATSAPARRRPSRPIPTSSASIPASAAC